MRTRWLGVCVAVLGLCLTNVVSAQTSSTAGAAKDAAQKQVIKKGREAYYSLRARGLDEFQSTVQPDWEKVLKAQGVTDSEQIEGGLKLLNSIHFTMVLDKNGHVTVTHSTDTEPPNEKARQGFEDIYSGMNQAVSGFFATWSMFMLNPPFPQVNDSYQLDDLGSQYRLTYNDGEADVATLMDKTFIITEIKVTSPKFVSIIKPNMTKTGQGLVMSAYTADYTPTSGPGVVHLNVRIDHAAVDGMQLPVSMILDSTLDGAPTHMELAFSDFRVKKH